MHDIAITKLNSFFSNFVIALINVTRLGYISFRNKFLWSFYETIHTSTSISWIYGFQMKQSLPNSPFIVDLPISQRGHSCYNDHWTSFKFHKRLPVTKMYVGVNISLIYIKLLTTQTVHKRLHYDNKVNFSSCSYLALQRSILPLISWLYRKINRYKINEDLQFTFVYLFYVYLCCSRKSPQPSQFINQDIKYNIM